MSKRLQALPGKFGLSEECVFFSQFSGTLHVPTRSGDYEDHLRSCSFEGRSVRLIIVDGAFGETCEREVSIGSDIYIFRNFDRTSIHVHISK